MGEATLVGGDAIQVPAVDAVRGLLQMEAEVANRLRESAGEDLAPLKLDRFEDVIALSKLGDFRMAARKDLGVPAASLAPAHLQQGSVRLLEELTVVFSRPGSDAPVDAHDPGPTSRVSAEGRSPAHKSAERSKVSRSSVRMSSSW
ncbi:hypothetical protein ACQP1U_10075 [Actinomycetota bacterium]